MLGLKAIKEFKVIYHKNYGVELTDKEAQEKATKFLEFFKVIYKPINDFSAPPKLNQ